jgi:hypothetical protein
MRAVVLEGYGSADKLKFVQDFPEPGPPVKHEVPTWQYTCSYRSIGTEEKRDYNILEMNKPTFSSNESL